MAATKIGATATYQGLSTDDKPASVVGGFTIPEGSTFHCVDTGEEYVLFNDVWVLDLRKAAAFKRALSLPMT
jgi:hypothetical protein